LAEGVAAAPRHPDDRRPDPAAGDRPAERVSPVAAGLEGEEQSSSSGGRFFAVDARVWPEVCAAGLNAAVAYLVLASGTGKDMVHTSWSVHAVEKYTSISRLHADKVIRALIERRLLSPAGGTRKFPRHRLHLAGETPLTSPSPRDSPDSEIPWIWLPNTLVTSAAGEIPPVELVRQMQDVTTLRLLVDLYGWQHLRVEGGVRRDLLWLPYKRQSLGNTAQFTVWGFRSTPMKARVPVCYAEPADPDAVGFFARIQSLEDVGLIEFIPHLVEGDGQDAEILHPYGTGGSDSLEDRLGTAASEAAYALLTETSKPWAGRLHVAPVLRHIRSVQMVGIARLRYRAQTRATAAWLAEMHQSGARHLEVYERIVAKHRADTRRCNING